MLTIVNGPLVVIAHTTLTTISRVRWRRPQSQRKTQPFESAHHISQTVHPLRVIQLPHPCPLAQYHRHGSTDHDHTDRFHNILVFGSRLELGHTRSRERERERERGQLSYNIIKHIYPLINHPTYADDLAIPHDI